MAIHKTGFNSTALQSAEYDDETHELKIEFDSGNMYVYGDVSMTTYEGLRDAKSAGRYFQTEIKDQYEIIRSR